MSAALPIRPREPQPAAPPSSTAGAAAVEAPSPLGLASVSPRDWVDASAAPLLALDTVVARRGPIGTIGAGVEPQGGDAPTVTRGRRGPQRPGLSGNPPVYDPGFQARVTNDKGAYFRKVESKLNLANKGIEVDVTLPAPKLDPARAFEVNGDPDHHQSGPLDRPSVYVGGHGAGHVLDAGLSWMRVYNKDGRPTYTSQASGTDGGDPDKRFVIGPNGVIKYADGRALSAEEAARVRGSLVPNFAYRVFWRTSTGKNTWANPPKEDQRQYFYPNERVQIRAAITAQGHVQLDVQARGRGYSTDIAMPGWGAEPVRFKRVMSIDQFEEVGGSRASREGKDTLPTASTLLGGRYHSATLLDAAGRPREALTGRTGVVVKGGDKTWSYDSVFRISGANRQGGESVDIRPPRP